MVLGNPQRNAAVDTPVGAVSIAAGGLDPAEALTGAVTGEVATAAADPDDNGFFATIGRVIAIVAVNHRGEMGPAVDPTGDVRHVHRPGGPVVGLS